MSVAGIQCRSCRSTTRHGVAAHKAHRSPNDAESSPRLSALPPQSGRVCTDLHGNRREICSGINPIYPTHLNCRLPNKSPGTRCESAINMDDVLFNSSKHNPLVKLTTTMYNVA
ncbi:hypothetical protein J6590_018995 [Homalodisca vitripennis]|nr:hypothetical protein J6590_018995 [Homalodisca vitripennis]